MVHKRQKTDKKRWYNGNPITSVYGYIMERFTDSFIEPFMDHFKSFFVDHKALFYRIQ
jgi:hypothetical protein